MNKLILSSLIVFLLVNTVKAESPAVPGCACNDFSALLKYDKKIEDEAKKEIEQMDTDAENIDKNLQSSPPSQPALQKKHWWQFRR